MTRQLGESTLISRGLRFKGSPPAEVIPVQNVKLRLDTWRDAEPRLDGLALGSSEWKEAEEDVRHASKVPRQLERRRGRRYGGSQPPVTGTPTLIEPRRRGALL